MKGGNLCYHVMTAQLSTRVKIIPTSCLFCTAAMACHRQGMRLAVKLILVDNACNLSRGHNDSYNVKWMSPIEVFVIWVLVAFSGTVTMSDTYPGTHSFRPIISCRSWVTAKCTILQQVCQEWYYFRRNGKCKQYRFMSDSVLTGVAQFASYVCHADVSGVILNCHWSLLCRFTK